MYNIIFIIAYLVIRTLADEADPLLVELENGRLRGRDVGGYYSYESIPYAEPPVGDLRFEPPQPYTRQWEDIYDATKPPVLCMQWSQLISKDDKLAGEEDCLTVNVYKPKRSGRSTFPVVVNIHGGVFMYGGPKGHETVMASGNVIVVELTYRLGPLGFLSTEDLELPGNLGLKDQRLALQWIKMNIARFGGEPENILIMGNGAGGASVHLQLLQEGNPHLTRVAVSMSGTALDPWVVQQGARRRAFELGRIVGCGLLNSSTELRECLKSIDATQIVAAVRQFLVFNYVPFTPFGPVVEPKDTTDPFLTLHPSEIIKSGKFAQVPWLVSYTTENGGFNGAILLTKQPNGKELIEELNNRWNDLAPYFLFYRNSMKSVDEMDDYSRDIRQAYLGNQNFSADSYVDVQRMFTDVLFKRGVEKSIVLHRQHGKSPVFTYIYSNPAQVGIGQLLSMRNDVNFGSVFSDDFSLVFEPPGRKLERNEDKIISTNLIRMLESFAETGILAYDECEFQDNVGQKQFQLLSISKTKCDTMQVDQLPPAMQ